MSALVFLCFLKKVTRSDELCPDYMLRKNHMSKKGYEKKTGKSTSDPEKKDFNGSKVEGTKGGGSNDGKKQRDQN